MKKLLVICGPTATGKTSLALKLAPKFNGEIISADSRQVYKYMDIGTGKDLPKGAKYKMSGIKSRGVELGYYEIKHTKIWGYDLVRPTEEFSVSQYKAIAEKIIFDIIKRNKLPIVVGGTGLYIKALLDGIETVNITKNVKLRKNLEDKLPTELFEILANMDPTKAASLNTSDKKNPRRLIRAIEIADYMGRHTLKKANKKYFDYLLIGLSASGRYLEDRIKKRVKQRWERGILEEINELFKIGVTWDDQAMDALGYRQWKDYFEERASTHDVLRVWSAQDVKYAKRQMTWFKKDTRVIWFDVEKKGWQLQIEKVVNKWYKNIR